MVVLTVAVYGEVIGEVDHDWRPIGGCDRRWVAQNHQRRRRESRPLKKGFAVLGRDLIGMDGCFMKQPAQGHILTAVRVDSNNGIYPVAYAIVEQECYSSWKWFLEWLGFCLRHIHQNMKKKWNGLAYKNHLWRCATATTVPEFELAMNQLKEFNKDCHKWLTDIPPHQWVRSHFLGRAVSDVLLSNMCEVFNRWLIDARDKPIVTALEYIREYLMKRIVNVLKHQSKCDGPLTPAATKTFEKIKEEASQCSILWNGGQQYQVTGPHGKQCVVDMGRRECACRKWELTGMPCKHVVACLNNMTFNNQQVGVPEEWVHQVHWLMRWKETYKFHIVPLNGKSMWPKSNDPTKILPPLKIATAGRPKKNRRKYAEEISEMNENGKLSRKGKSEQCGKCGTYGHNKRGCPNEASTFVGTKTSSKRKRGERAQSQTNDAACN
ncbi:uncharacterized protein [Rutidosis leptorrhynchoides]|uniref:uncharacterized protein n=1 Tax=Rutidosis leptorrhynchoides TaxID=125765 RepID=UPI003A9985A2